jgi:hypothetical protein
MKTYASTFIFLACACLLLTAACHNNNNNNNNNSQPNKKLQGSWKSKDGITNLKITNKQFTLDNEAEDYFLKGDTIFTSFEGNLPYTKFVIQKLDEKQLSLLFPDSVAVEFSR